MSYTIADKQAITGETWVEALFLFSKTRIRAKAETFLIEAKYDFRLQGEHAVRVNVPAANLPLLIGQLGGVLTYYELTKTQFVTVQNDSSTGGCEVFRMRPLDRIVRFPSQNQDVLGQGAGHAHLRHTCQPAGAIAAPERLSPNPRVRRGA